MKAEVRATVPETRERPGSLASYQKQKRLGTEGSEAEGGKDF